MKLKRRSVQSQSKSRFPTRRIAVAFLVNLHYPFHRPRDTQRMMCAMKKAGVFSILFVVMLLVVAVVAEAQQPKKVLRIGWLSAGSSATTGNLEAFRKELIA